ncbi:MAG: spore cortex biosynthesis protein YabQ [Alicyclobacillus macrosporangiidus]|uniref:spore cortex biosynthesis protein YabQ n=1 Tax=Alicyclobacillus macrosporangiidus TaxID=392015 RepID=UPI0026E9576A|nr:spore cortex biosynthesis protein YabQ [Alicyclobacillus macrosporangiidus]MCL6599337.1 spore cortex biosynthesis protein YabQ [Alicyclobacillus macrosporangiidus]
MAAQWIYLTALMAAGLLMGTVFDLYNTVTGASRWFRWLRPTLDLLFWLVSAALVYHLVFRFDDGRVRLYVFLLLGAGYVLYRATVRRLVIRSAFAVVWAVRGLIHLVWRAVYTLLVAPILLWLRLLWRLLRLVYQVLCRLEDTLFWLLGLAARLTGLNRLLNTVFMKRIFHTIHTHWEDFWTAASKWVKSKCVRD